MYSYFIKSRRYLLEDEAPFTQFKREYFIIVLRAIRCSATLLFLSNSGIAFLADYENKIQIVVGSITLLVLNFIFTSLLLINKAYQKYIVIYLALFGSATVIYLFELFRESLETDSKVEMFAYGMLLGLFSCFLVQARTPWKSMLKPLVTLMAYAEIRFFPNEDELFRRLSLTISLLSFLLVLIWIYYHHDRTELAEFLKLQSHQRQLEFFKRLLEDLIPNEILIIGKDKNCKEMKPKILFLNKSAQRLFKTSNTELIMNMLEEFKLNDIKLFESGEIDQVREENSFISVFTSSFDSQDGENFRKFYADFKIKKPREEWGLTELDEEDWQVRHKYEMNVSRIEWDDENNKAVIIILNDISKTHRISELEVLHKNKDRLLATISHNLRTPLNGLIGMLESGKNIVRDNKQDFEQAPELNDVLDIALDTGKILMFIINDILDTNIASKGQLHMKFAEENVCELTKEVCSLVSHNIKLKGISFNFTCKIPYKTTIFTDKTRLQQVLLNLLSNAMKFTDSGAIDFEISLQQKTSFCMLRESANLLEDSNNTLSSEILFSISDTGIGIKEDNLGSLFKIFSKQQISENITGVGIGLSISQRIIKALKKGEGAGIEVQSEPGVGSKFWFTLPLYEKEFNDRSFSYSIGEDNPLLVPSMNNFNPLISQNILLSTSPPKQAYVLIIDDDPLNLLVLSKYFKGVNGVKIETAKNGLEAVERVKSFATSNRFFQLLLMDCNMPIMDGYKASLLIKQLSNEGLIPKPTILAVTANVNETDHKKCLSSGMDKVITKPITQTIFKEKILSLINL